MNAQKTHGNIAPEILEAASKIGPKSAEFFKASYEDVKLSIEELKNGEPSQRQKRAFVRNFFALVEGDTYYRKQVVLQFSALAEQAGVKIPLTAAEIAMLRDEQYELDHKGLARTSTKFLKLKNNVQFAFKIYARVFAPGFSLETGSEGWQQFGIAIDVRNRITHPKSVVDLSISNDDFAKIKLASKWYGNSVLTLFAEQKKRNARNTTE